MDRFEFIKEVQEILELITESAVREDADINEYGRGDFEPIIDGMIENGYDWNQKSIDATLELLLK